MTPFGSPSKCAHLSETLTLQLRKSSRSILWPPARRPRILSRHETSSSNLRFQIEDFSFREVKIIDVKKILLKLRTAFDLRTFLFSNTLFIANSDFKALSSRIELGNVIFRGHPQASWCWGENTDYSRSRNFKKSLSSTTI